MIKGCNILQKKLLKCPESVLKCASEQPKNGGCRLSCLTLEFSDYMLEPGADPNSGVNQNRASFEWTSAGIFEWTLSSKLWTFRVDMGEFSASFRNLIMEVF